MSFLDQMTQFTLSGIMVGSIYAVIALGYTMVYRATDAINFAQGEFVMLGGMIGVALRGYFGFSIPLVMLLSVLCVTLIGIMLARITIYSLKNVNPVDIIIVTIGASILLKGSTMMVWGKDAMSFPSFSGDKPISVLGAAFLPQGLWILGISGLLLVGVHFFFQATLTGKAMKGCAANRWAATLVGIDAKRMDLYSFALAGFTGSIAGIIITPVTLISWDRGLMLGLKGFSGAMLGGFNSIFGSALGGFILGLLETYCAGLLSSDYKDAIAFLILILVLFSKPQGLFGKVKIEKL